MHSELIAALSTPMAYEHEVAEPIHVIETHISWLFLTGEFAYKIKKPVDFGFLNFTTLGRRRHYCEEELRLNQRLAPDIYRTMMAVVGPLSAPRMIPANQVTEADDILEYAVQMYQFDDEQRLDRILSNKRFEAIWIDRLAEQIADFHQRVPHVAQDSPWGETTTIWEVAGDNYTHLTAAQLTPDDWQQLQLLSQRAAQQFRKLIPALERRKREGHIRECHGDLHLANITLFHDALRLFDCIEFNLQFRWIDTICDLAFLLMDLEAKGEYRGSNRLLNRYLELSGDYQGLEVLNFYKSYRAMVRAKVAMLGEQPNFAEFRRYLHLTQSYTQQNKPTLFLMHGVSGSGKSYLSQQLVEQSDCIRIRSDVERKRLYRELSRRGESPPLYGQEMNARTFQHLLELARSLLAAGYAVIVDATFIRARTRQSYFQLAESLDIPVRIISCECEKKLIETRLRRRSDEGVDASDADVEVMKKQLIHAQPLTAHEEPFAFFINTGDDEAASRLVHHLVSQGLIHS